MKEGIHFGDCLELIEKIPDKYLDAVITDPPYGIGYQSSRRTDNKKAKILNDEKPFTDWIEPAFRKLKDGGRLICFYRWDVQGAFLDSITQAGFTVKSQIIWDKVVHGMGDLKEQFAPQHESVIYAVKGRYKFKGKRPKSVYRCKRIPGEELIHPNQKPIELMAAIIRDITIVGETVLDPFGGSFSTYIAATRNRRKAISFELHEEYYKTGLKNADLESGKQLLFI